MKIHIYEAKDGLFYWRAVARNGRIIADGGEGYTRKAGAVRAVKRDLYLFATAKIVIDE